MLEDATLFLVELSFLFYNCLKVILKCFCIVVRKFPTFSSSKEDPIFEAM